MTGRIISGGEIDIKYDTRGLGEFYFEEAEKHGNKICQIDATTGQKETYESVKQRATKLAIHMRKLGLTSQDVILCCIRNTLDNTIPVLAALYLGAKVSSVDASQSVRDCAHCISLVKPKYIFVEQESLQLIEDSIKEAKFASVIIVIGESKKYKTFSELQQPTGEEQSFRPVTVSNVHDTAVIFFSSGTTGMPKGICTTHFGNLNANKSVGTVDYIDTKNILHLSSLYWISAKGLMVLAYLTGGCRVLTTKFGAEDFFRIIEKYRVTTAFLAPAYTHALVDVKDVEKYDTSSLSNLVLGGSPISPAQLKRTREVFNHTFVSVGYGTTEALGFIAGFSYSRDRHLIDRYGSSGKCVKGTEIKIVDVDTRKILGPNQKGEVCIKSPFISPGYYNNPTNICDEDGFIKSGDIGYYDEDECIYIIDRIKEMFKCRSWHIVPSFLEAILLEHPSVKETAVFGVPHEVDEFWPAACVVLKEGFNATEEDINDFYSPKVASYQQLRGGIKIVKAIPKGPSGKLVRWKLREHFTNIS